MQNLAPILREHPFFKLLGENHLENLVHCSSNVKFKAGEFIFKEGEDAAHLYLIRHGRVSLELHSPHLDSHTIQTVGEGEVLGWSWLVSPFQWLSDAKAVDLVRAIQMDGHCLREKCDADHELGYHMYKNIASMMQERLHNALIQLLDLYATPEK